MKRTSQLGVAVSLACVFGHLCAAADKPQWYDATTVVEQAHQAGRHAGLLFGRPECPYTEPARLALDAELVRGVVDGSLLLAYVDMSTPTGATLKTKYRVDSTPILVLLSPSGSEEWRMIAPEDPEKAASILRQVLTGSLTTSGQLRLWRKHRLDSVAMLDLATALAESDRKGEAKQVLFDLLRPHTRASDSDRRKASARLIELSDPKEQLAAYQAHLARFPDDWLQWVNYGFTLLQQGGPDSEVEKVISRALPAIRDHESEFAMPNVLSAYRLAHDYTLLRNPTYAEIALPFAERALTIAPGDAGNLTDLAMLAVLSDHVTSIDAGKNAVRAFYSERANSDERKTSLEKFIDEAVQEGRKNATLAPLKPISPGSNSARATPRHGGAE